MFGWSLYELDETDVVSLLDFIQHYPQWKGKSKGKKEHMQFIDQVNWL